jgi:platelet-activating factor acetylhydrolase
VPSFPEYTGPYTVGTIDVEIPVAELEAPSPAPDDSIPTVQFRIFYPCEADSNATKGITWLPLPQRAHVSAYTKFMGASSRLAEVISYVLNPVSFGNAIGFKEIRSQFLAGSSRDYSTIFQFQPSEMPQC